MVNFGKRMRGCSALLEGDEETPSPSAHRDREVARGIHQAIGGHELRQIVTASGEPRGEQDRIRFGGVQRSERAVADPAVSQHLAAFEFQVAERSGLQGRRGGEGRGQQEKKEYAAHGIEQL
jgi:hypothetical protein